MTIDIFALKGELNGKILLVRFFFCRVYFHRILTDSAENESDKDGKGLSSHIGYLVP